MTPNDSESRYLVFALGGKAPLLLLKHGWELKGVNSRLLSCSLESLSIALHHTYTRRQILDCDSVFIHNCKLFFWEFGKALCSPPSLSAQTPPFSSFPLEAACIALQHKLLVHMHVQAVTKAAQRVIQQVLTN